MARIQFIDEVGDALKSLKEKGKTLSLAESCTGGLIAHKLTNIKGSSENFLLGLVTYTNKMKHDLLKVPFDILDTFGAVSKETATEMAKGIAKLAKSDLGISITGFADGEKAGEVYLGIHNRKKKATEVLKFIFKGGRKDIKEQAAQTTIEEITRILKEDEKKSQKD